MLLGVAVTGNSVCPSGEVVIQYVFWGREVGDIIACMCFMCSRVVLGERSQVAGGVAVMSGSQCPAGEVVIKWGGGVRNGIWEVVGMICVGLEGCGVAEGVQLQRGLCPDTGKQMLLGVAVTGNSVCPAGEVVMK